MNTNAQILAAILNRFVQPVIQQLAGSKLSSLPILGALENKIRSTGWVSPSWNVAKELSPFMEAVTGSIVEPMIAQFLKDVPDEALPEIAHNIVNKALKEGQLSLFEGMVVFEADDLQTMKNLLDKNLPCKHHEKVQLEE